jgi:hypothetical protein
MQSCLIYVICVCLRKVVSNTHCVAFFCCVCLRLVSNEFRIDAMSIQDNIGINTAKFVVHTIISVNSNSNHVKQMVQNQLQYQLNLENLDCIGVISISDIFSNGIVRILYLVRTSVVHVSSSHTYLARTKVASHSIVPSTGIVYHN